MGTVIVMSYVRQAGLEDPKCRLVDKTKLEMQLYAGLQLYKNQTGLNRN